MVFKNDPQSHEDRLKELTDVVAHARAEQKRQAAQMILAFCLQYRWCEFSPQPYEVERFLDEYLPV